MQSQTLSGFFSFIPFQIKRRIQPNHCPYLQKWYNIIKQSPRYNLSRLEQYGNLKIITFWN